MSARAAMIARRVALFMVVLVAAWVLFVWVFPWVDRQLNDPVLGDGRVAVPAQLVTGGPTVGRPAECGNQQHAE